MKYLKKLFFLTIFGLSVFYSRAQKGIIKTYKATSNSEIINAISKSKAGDCILIVPGEYKDIKLVLENSGTESHPIVLKAEKNGTVIFIGDVKVELKGNHIVFEGFHFKNGNRNPKEWRSHGPGLVAIYGSNNRVTQCAFHAFDEVPSAYITTSLTQQGSVPQHCRIDHCSFTDKTTFDQVINLNNTPKKSTEGAPGIPMYHRVDHCYFSNPKKPGNAGGGIRIGYWRKDFGRCLIDNNLFERQDSEPEIITSKSQENIFYKNTYKNCRGTLNFRHGDKQVALHNFFITTDKKHEYGGMFVWGSEHLIASNYFQLNTTIKSRGNAALYLNSGTKGDEHALFYNSQITNNYFINTNGYAIDFQGLKERRKERCAALDKAYEIPHDIQLKGNVFYSKSQNKKPFFNIESPKKRNLHWSNNYTHGANLGMPKSNGVLEGKINFNKNNDYFITSKEFPISTVKTKSIEGLNFDIEEKANLAIFGKPLTWREVGPSWLKENPSTYAQTGKLSKMLSARLKKLKKK